MLEVRIPQKSFEWLVDILPIGQHFADKDLLEKGIPNVVIPYSDLVLIHIPRKETPQ